MPLLSIVDTLIASTAGDLQNELLGFKASVSESGVSPEDVMFAGSIAARLSGTELEQLANDMFAAAVGG